MTAIESWLSTSLKINYAVQEIINPAQLAGWPATSPKYFVRQVTGIDISDLFIARIGVRNNNDLAWIGRAANHAAKLASLREDNFATYITSDVYQMLDQPLRHTNAVNMWESRVWSAFDKSTIYRSNWRWGSA
jgi:class 3 adenylate cyclase